MRTPLVAAAGALAALALWQAVPGRRDTPAPALAPPPRAEPPHESDVAPTRVPRAIEQALDRHVAAAGIGALPDGGRVALRDALMAVRRASTRARRRSRDPMWQAEQSRALVEADRVFREKLGIGLAEFLADAGPPGRVEDLGRAPRS